MSNFAAPTVSIKSTDINTGQHVIHISADVPGRDVGRGLVWGGQQPAWVSFQQPDAGEICPEFLTGWPSVGKICRDLDMTGQNIVQLNGPYPENLVTDKHYANDQGLGPDIPYQKRTDAMAALRAARSTFEAYHPVLRVDLTDAQIDAMAAYWRDHLADLPEIKVEWGNEFDVSLLAFSGAQRVVLDGIRNGYGRDGVTWNTPVTPQNITFIAGNGSNAHKQGNTDSPAVPADTWICYTIYGSLLDIFVAKQDVPAGTEIYENAYWSRRTEINGVLAGRQWRLVRNNQILDRIKAVMGADRYAAQIRPVYSGNLEWGGCLAQWQMEMVFVPGFWDKITDIGASYYFGPSTNADLSNVTTKEQVEALARANDPIVRQQVLGWMADVAYLGKRFTNYEGGPDVLLTTSGIPAAYRQAATDWRNSSLGQAYYHDVTAFIMGLPGDHNQYDLIAHGAYSVMDWWGDTQNPRLLGLLNATGTPTPTPAPTVNAKPVIGTDGTPQVGEPMTGQSGTYTNGTVSGRAWLLGGTAISGATGATYVPQATGSLTYQETVNGAGGTITSTSDPVTVAAAAPSVTPLPSGIAAMWDAASLSALANGANVTSWTDSIGGDVATTTGGTPHTYAANAGGLPAVRLSKADVLASTANGAAANATNSGSYGVIVVAGNIQNGDGNPCLTAIGTGTSALLQANASSTGHYQEMLPCASAGMRTVGMSVSSHANLMSINGTTFVDPVSGSGQVFIGGWQNAGTACCGKADIYAVIVFNRPVTAADFKQVHRRYCELLGQARPGGASFRHVTFLGDSLTAGVPDGLTTSTAYQMAQALGWEWGTWDNLGIAGVPWNGPGGSILGDELPLTGNISAATGTKNIVPMFEWYNMAGQSVSTIVAAAQAVVNALHSQDPNREIILGTSTDAGSATGVTYRQNRADYNAQLVADAVTGVTTLVRLDLDPNVGVQGAAPTAWGSGNVYYADVPHGSDQWDYGIHMKALGYAQIDNGPYGFRPAVQARLAA